MRIVPATGAEAAAPSDTEDGLRSLMRKRAALPAAFVLALFLAFFLNLHAIPLFDVDEGAFSEATREMLERGDYVTTYLNGNLRFDKPILIYWLQAVSVSLFGVNEFAFRLPSALASVGWMCAILAFVRRHADRTTGFAAALIGATTLGITIIGRGAIADALLNLFLALTMFDMYRYLEQPQRRYCYRAYAWMGLGMLTKGPIAVLIPLAVGSMVFFFYKKRAAWWRAVFDPAGWLIFLAIAAPWYVMEYLRQGQAFIDGFFLHHNVERFRNPLQGHGGGWLYYLPALLFLLLPYSGLFIRVLPSVRTVKSHSLAGFLWAWFLFVLVFFSLSGTKLPHYLLYGVTPMVILMALYRQQLQSAWLAFLPAIFLACLALVLPTLAGLAAARIDNRFYQEMLSRQDVFGTSYYFAVALMLAAIAGLMAMRGIAVWQRLVAAGFVVAAALSGAILPAVGEMQQGAVREAAAVARQTGLPVSTWQITMPSFSVYLGAVTPSFVPPGHGQLILTRTDRMAPLGPVETLYRKGGIALVRKTD